MARFNIQVATAADSILPRDRIVNVWHFDRPLALPENPGQLCEDMANIYDTIMAVGVGRHEYDVRLYAESVIGPPLAKFVKNPGIAAPSDWPREVALCLSFRGATNTPSTRGRVYLSPSLMVSQQTSVRPGEGIRTVALEMATAVAGLGGADIDWGVFSPKNNTFTKVTVAYVDDEWDTVRSRGLRATTRTQLAVSG
jgi:hypothetical protein